MVGADAPQGVELQILGGLVNYVSTIVSYLVLSDFFFSCKLQAVIYFSLHDSIFGSLGSRDIWCFQLSEMSEVLTCTSI